MIQLVFDCLDMNNFDGIFGNWAKFVLSLITLVFDVRKRVCVCVVCKHVLYGRILIFSFSFLDAYNGYRAYTLHNITFYIETIVLNVATL